MDNLNTAKATPADKTDHHLAFLASSWNSTELRDLRVRIGQRFENDTRGRVWVAERDAKHLNPDHGIDQLEIIDACLDAIEASKLFILVDTGEYGSHEPPRLYRRAKLSENCPLWNRHTTRRPRSRIHLSSANVQCGWRWNTAKSIVAKLPYSLRLQAN